MEERNYAVKIQDGQRYGNLTRDEAFKKRKTLFEQFRQMGYPKIPSIVVYYRNGSVIEED